MARHRLAHAPALGAGRWPADERDRHRAVGRRRAGAGTIVWIHGLSGSLAELAGEPAALRRRRTAASRWTCRASARREMPAEKITISGYAALVDELLRALGVTRADGRGQLDGRLHRRRAGDPLRHLGREARAGQRRGADDRAPAQRARAGAAAAQLQAAGAVDRLAGLEVRDARAPPAFAPGDARARRRASRSAAGAVGRRAAARRRQAGLRRCAGRADRLPHPRSAAARSRRRRSWCGAPRTCSCRSATPGSSAS